MCNALTMRARASARCKDENVAAACESEERLEVHRDSQYVNGYDEVDLASTWLDHQNLMPAEAAVKKCTLADQ